MISSDPTTTTRDWLTRLLWIPAVLLVTRLLWLAWTEMDLAWDAAAYQIQFSALRAGVVSPEDYRLSRWMNTLYSSFPVFADYVRGYLWKLTGHPPATNLLSMAGLLTVVAALWRIFRVPAPYPVLAMLASPVILIHSHGSYVDLFANSMMTVVLLVCLLALLWPEQVRLWHLMIALAAAAMAINTKFHFLGVGPLALLCLAGTLWRQRRRLKRLGPVLDRTAGRAGLALAVVLFVVASATHYVGNWRRFGNPVYPLSVYAGKIRLPGPVVFGTPDPIYVAPFPQPVRWLLSVTEFRAFEGRAPLWTADQGSVPNGSLACRMGGYFSAWVGLNLLWLALLNWRARRRLGWKPIGFLAVVTAVTSWQPVSQELRYYMFWMMTLVSVNLVLLEEQRQEPGGGERRGLYMGGALCALAFVLSATGLQTLLRQGAEPEGLADRAGITRTLEAMKLAPGETVCVFGKNPYSFFYAPYFNPKVAGKTPYHVIEAYDAAECGTARRVP